MSNLTLPDDIDFTSIVEEHIESIIWDEEDHEDFDDYWFSHCEDDKAWDVNIWLQDNCESPVDERDRFQVAVYEVVPDIYNKGYFTTKTDEWANLEGFDEFIITEYDKKKGKI